MVFSLKTFKYGESCRERNKRLGQLNDIAVFFLFPIKLLLENYSKPQEEQKKKGIEKNFQSHFVML